MHLIVLLLQSKLFADKFFERVFAGVHLNEWEVTWDDNIEFIALAIETRRDEQRMLFMGTEELEN